MIKQKNHDINVLYENTINLLNFTLSTQQINVHDDEKERLNLCTKLASDPNPVFVLQKSHYLRRELLQMSGGLSISDIQIRSVLQDDEAYLIKLFSIVLNSDAYTSVALQLEDENTQQLLDAVQEIFDRLPMHETSRDLLHRVRRLILKLSKRTGMLPSSLLINGVTNVASEPTFSGGFGDIFRASYNGTDIALKRIRVYQRDLQSKVRQKLYREALVWHNLKHPNVLAFLGVDADSFSSSLCLVSPWMKHGTIVKYLNDNGRSRLHHLLLEIAQGLRYLHSQNVVHGDLRGSNVLIDDEWHARLADFGLTVFSDVDKIVTTTVTYGGTTRWMAPELHDPDSFGIPFRRTLASDVYSFAMVVLELCTGQPPFADVRNDMTAVLRLLKGHRPSRPATGVSDPLWKLVQKCWRQEFEYRPSMIDVVHELEEPQKEKRLNHTPKLSVSVPQVEELSNAKENLGNVTSDRKGREESARIARKNAPAVADRRLQQVIQEAAKKFGAECPHGFDWKKTDWGYVCGGGRHKLTFEQLDFEPLISAPSGITIIDMASKVKGKATRRATADAPAAADQGMQRIIQRAAKKFGVECPQGFRWKQADWGYVCEGGGHKLTFEQLEFESLIVAPPKLGGTAYEVVPEDVDHDEPDSPWTIEGVDLDEPDSPWTIEAIDGECSGT